MSIHRLWLTLGVLVFGGCEISDEDFCSDAGECTTVDGGTSTPTPGGWSVHEHPCLEHRTDALLVEGQTLWTGCGTGAEGRGLWLSEDGGATWAAPTTEPADVFDTWRVNDVVRGPDDLLYVAGIDTAGRATVATLDTAQRPAAFAVRYERGDLVGTSFQVGSLAVSSSGAAIAESLTGVDLVHRADAASPWIPMDRYTTDGESYQILQVRAFGPVFYAVGSTITQPPTVFVPNDAAAQDTPLFEAVALSEGRGELWGLDVAPTGRIVAVGVDQDRDVGLAFVSAIDDYAAERWRRFDVSDQIEGRSWLRGACASVGALVVVGERQPLTASGALAFRTTDNGRTWTNISPTDGPKTLSRCQIMDDGTVWAAGSFGWTGHWAP